MLSNKGRLGALLLLFECLSLCHLKSLKAEHLHKTPEPPIFISLGSHCEVSQQLILNNLRSAAFPFDWLLTFDFSRFLALIREDFALFMDKRYLYQDHEGIVLHTYYNIDFRHELHDWPDNDFAKHYTEIREKYQRRIHRFRECKYNKSKAYFIRAAFDLNLDSHLPTITKECSKIDRLQASALKDVLSERFPKLDFCLVIINYEEEKAEDIIGIDRVLEFKIRKSHKKEDYTNLFQHLVEYAKCSN